MWILWITNAVGCRPRPAFPFVTVPIISFIPRADSAFSTAIFAFYFRPVITEVYISILRYSESNNILWDDIKTNINYIYLNIIIKMTSVQQEGKCSTPHLKKSEVFPAKNICKIIFKFLVSSCSVLMNRFSHWNKSKSVGAKFNQMEDMEKPFVLMMIFSFWVFALQVCF